MKKRILFVDDEAFVLEGLQRMLRAMRNEWDMTFVGSGQRALELMAQQPFDVVVTDMRMPGMNGAELLNEVMRRYPKTIRLVLSGYADNDLMMECIGFTHQYLSKPCSAEDLRKTLARAAALDATLENDAIRRLLIRLDHLPSVPFLYGELVEIMQRPDILIEEVAQVVAHDPAVTATMLKLVNSAFFGKDVGATSAYEACMHLGLDAMRSLVLSIQTFSQFQSYRLGALKPETVWRHSLRTAKAAKRIAQLQDASRKTADEAFAGGLLHDVGKLILADNCVDDYRRVLKRAREVPEELIEAEKAIFGCNHADVGGYLLGLWGLPVPVVEAIALHHCPSQSQSVTFDPLAAVYVANVLVQERDGSNESVVRRGLDHQYLVKLGLQDRVDSWRLEIGKIT